MFVFNFLRDGLRDALDARGAQHLIVRAHGSAPVRRAPRPRASSPCSYLACHSGRDSIESERFWLFSPCFFYF